MRWQTISNSRNWLTIRHKCQCHRNGLQANGKRHQSNGFNVRAQIASECDSTALSFPIQIWFAQMQSERPQDSRRRRQSQMFAMLKWNAIHTHKKNRDGQNKTDDLTSAMGWKSDSETNGRRKKTQTHSRQMQSKTNHFIGIDWAIVEICARTTTKSSRSRSLSGAVALTFSRLPRFRFISLQCKISNDNLWRFKCYYIR